MAADTSELTKEEILLVKLLFICTEEEYQLFAKEANKDVHSTGSFYMITRLVFKYGDELEDFELTKEMVDRWIILRGRLAASFLEELPNISLN